MKIADDSYGKEASACIMYIELVHVSGIIVIATVRTGASISSSLLWLL
ncbi:hypothetical protein BCSJ1_10393 [Bacillus cereus SJ1]|nr:hypothetical protein BCSJ1_10393 [Bacillus cereus SJ1]